MLNKHIISSVLICLLIHQTIWTSVSSWVVSRSRTTTASPTTTTMNENCTLKAPTPSAAAWGWLSRQCQPEYDAERGRQLRLTIVAPSVEMRGNKSAVLEQWKLWKVKETLLGLKLFYCLVDSWTEECQAGNSPQNFFQLMNALICTEGKPNGYYDRIKLIAPFILLWPCRASPISSEATTYLQAYECQRMVPDKLQFLGKTMSDCTPDQLGPPVTVAERKIASTIENNTHQSVCYQDGETQEDGTFVGFSGSSGSEDCVGLNVITENCGKQVACEYRALLWPQFCDSGRPPKCPSPQTTTAFAGPTRLMTSAASRIGTQLRWTQALYYLMGLVGLKQHRVLIP